MSQPINFSGYIRHLRGGMDYSGIIILDNKIFPYRLKLGIPIEKFVEAAGANQDSLTSHFAEFNVSRIPVAAMPLEDATIGLFRAIAGKLAFGIGNDPRAKNADEILVTYIPIEMKGSLLHAYRVSSSYSYSIDGQMPRTPQLEGLLDAYQKTELLTVNPIAHSKKSYQVN